MTDAQFWIGIILIAVAVLVLCIRIAVELRKADEPDVRRK
jgi:hypothetical protein